MSFDLWIALVALFGVGGLTPGPAVMLVLASSFRYGFKPAMLPALGIAAANVFWLLLAASGAASLAALYPKGFLALKIAGLLVIFYLAITTIFGALPNLDDNETEAPQRGKLFIRGFALQISSPLPLVFFGLLLPAYFVTSQPMAPQLLIMFITVTVTELWGLAVYAYGAQSIRRYLRSPKAARVFNIIIGVVMMASGLWAILSTVDHAGLPT
ncbi:MAG: LysE family translocator [Maricaulaceae bacterium]